MTHTSAVEALEHVLAAPFTLAGVGHLAVLVLGWRLLARAGRTSTGPTAPTAT